MIVHIIRQKCENIKALFTNIVLAHIHHRSRLLIKSCFSFGLKYDAHVDLEHRHVC